MAFYISPFIDNYALTLHDLSNDKILIKSKYTIVRYNLESDLKENISKLIPNDTENQLSLENRLFLKVIVNLQFFILENASYNDDISYRPNTDRWLVNDQYSVDNTYIYNLLSILFHKKTYNIINTLVKLITEPELYYFGQPSIYNNYKSYFEGLHPSINKKDHILEDITVKADADDAELYKLSFLDIPELNDIKVKTISSFVDAFIIFNDSYDNYKLLFSEDRINQNSFLFDLLFEIYKNHNFQIKMTEFNSLKDGAIKDEKKSEIYSFVYELIKAKKAVILKEEIDFYKLYVDSVYIEPFNYIQNIFKNIENPFPLMIKELKKKSEMTGYIQYIYHILYKIKKNINLTLTNIKTNLRIDEFFYKHPNSIIFRMLNEKIILIQNDAKYKDLINNPNDDNNIELLLKPTKEIIEYYLNFIQKISEIIPILLKEQIIPSKIVEHVDIYVNYCVETSLTHPTDIPEFHFLKKFDKKYDSKERVEARKKAEAAEKAKAAERQKLRDEMYKSSIRAAEAAAESAEEQRFSARSYI